MEKNYLLIAAAREGNLEAFGQIVEYYRGMAYAIAHRALQDADLAEDAVQEAFIEAYIHLPQLREIEAFPGWLRRIVLRQGKRLIRGKRISYVPLEASSACDVAVDELNPANVVESRETQYGIRQAITSLSEAEQIVVQLFYMTDYGIKDIANFLDISEGAVKKRLFTARKHLKTKLGGMLHEARSSYHHGSRYAAKIKLLIVTRLGDRNVVQNMLAQDPLLINATLHKQEAMGHFNIVEGHTPLHEAINSGDAQMVMLFLARGAHVNARNVWGATALHLAVLTSPPEIVHLLLQQKAIMHPTLNGLTPLHYASMKGRAEIARLLLQQQIDVDAQASSGRTALHWATIKGHRNIVEQLLRKDANRTLRDETGRTALDWAKHQGYQDIASVLKGEPSMKHGSGFSIGKEGLGRVMDSQGHIITGTGQSGEDQSTRYEIVETGIKAIDLLAPLARGGFIGLCGESGTGKLVAAEEILYRMFSHRQGYAVGLSMGEDGYETSEMMAILTEMGMKERCILFYERLGGPQGITARMVRAGLATAGRLQEQGHDVMLVADSEMTKQGNLLQQDQLRSEVYEKGITTLLLLDASESQRVQEYGQQGKLASWLIFSHELAQRNIWPAIDGLASGSRLLKDHTVSQRHIEVAHLVRQFLEKEIAEQHAGRSAKIQQFLTQPFFVAELYTEVPGEYVTLEETLQSFSELAEGQHDSLSEEAFSFVGAIDQAIEKERHLDK